ncbi:MAG: PEP-CTERM sorting domain-containing protein, partial [Thermoguttaceae bacterium]|nr:PEP-CTERM sorting domain-containing protein [Thermoguttaceae bacterium]
SMPSDTKTQAIDANINAAARPVIFAPEADYTLQLNGTLTSTGTVTKEGAGTLVFTNSQTLGTLVVSDGTLKINDGTTLTANSVTLAPQALLDLTLSSATADTPLLTVNGTLTSNSLEGEIAFSKDADTTIEAGDSFLLMTAAGMSDADFSSLNFAESNDSLIDFPGGVWNYSLQQLGSGIGIYATAQLDSSVPEPSAWLLLALGAFFLLRRKK